MAIDLKNLFSVDEDVDSKSLNALLKALKNNASAQFDFLKFRHSVLTMKEMNMDEEMAYKSAFTTASTIGVNKTSLLKSAKSYIAVLDKEKRQFNEALKKQLSDRVKTRQSDISKIETRLVSNKKKIQELLKENEVLEQKLNSLKSEIDGNHEKLTQTSQKFEHAWESLSKSIKEDVERIQDYL